MVLQDESSLCSFFSMLNCTQLCETGKGIFDCQSFEHPATQLFGSNAPLKWKILKSEASVGLSKVFRLPALVLAC